MPWSRDQAEHYADLGEQSHVPVLADALKELIGTGSNRSLLDFGCGGGELTLRVASLGFQRVLCIDESETLIRDAETSIRQRAPAPHIHFTFLHGNEDVLPRPEPFDVVLCSLVLMMCATRERLERCTRGLIRSLKPDGTLFIVLTHPCFRRAGYRTFHYELPKDYDYWDAGRSYEVVLEPPKGEQTSIRDHHWPLQDYVQAIVRSGSAIHGLHELPATWNLDGEPDSPPAYLVLAARGTP